MEIACCHRSLTGLENLFARQHPSVVRAVNARRKRMGLAEIRVAGDPSARPLRAAPPHAARKPAGASSWPRRPRTRAEHEELRRRAAAVIVAARAKLKRDRWASLLRSGE